MISAEEYITENLDSKADLGELEPKNELNPHFWDANQLKNEVSKQLKTIADDFIDGLDLLDSNIVDDITITGSSASYNWTKMSDIDLHMIINFKELDENIELVREFFSAKTYIWNKRHNIEIFGHEVEIYVQNTDEPHISMGVYSLKNDSWLSKPIKGDPDIDFESIRTKSLALMDKIERLYGQFEEKDYQEAREYAEKLKNKIKKMRRTGLDAAGVYSNENLVFKVLRRNGHLDLLDHIYISSYDNLRSLDQNYAKKLKIYVSKPEKPEIKGYNRLNEIGKYQKKMKRRHFLKKKWLIGGGKQKNVPPYSRKPSYKRAKSAPVGAGGS